MNEIVAEWIAKVEEDYRTAERELRVRKAPSHDVVCFHAQQCAEKYLKALLLQCQMPSSAPTWTACVSNLLIILRTKVSPAAAYRMPGTICLSRRSGHAIL